MTKMILDFLSVSAVKAFELRAAYDPARNNRYAGLSVSSQYG